MLNTNVESVGWGGGQCKGSQNWRSRVEALSARDKAPNMNAGVSGFRNAIVTKGMVVTCGALSLVLGARGDPKLCCISYQRILQRLELWRLVMGPFVFPSLPELIFGLYLLYFFRVFERQIGSAKYMFFVFFTTAITTFLELVFVFILKSICLDSSVDHSSRLEGGPRVCETGGAWRLYPTSLGCPFSEDLSSIASIRLNSGPVGLIFSSFVSFFFDIPVSMRVRQRGVEVSEKSFVYFVGLLLLLWSWIQSLIPGVCGVIAGLIYRYDVAGIQEIGFSPGAFGRLASSVAPFFSGISPEMAYRMNPDRSAETEPIIVDPLEVNARNHYSLHGWSAERIPCRCIDCAKHRRGIVQARTGSRSKHHSAGARLRLNE